MKILTLLVVTFALSLGPPAQAADSKKSSENKVPHPSTEPTLGDSLGGAEQVNVDKIKEKYWARGDESELGVVQNRTYTKTHKIELSLLGGLIFTDPFLSVQSFGGSLSYHFSEYLAASIMYNKYFTSQSSAVSAAQQTISSLGGAAFIPPTNYPSSFYGAEAVWSVLYGKLSVLGKSIIYYDMHLLGGMGVTSTESGSDITGDIGLGQQVFLSKRFSIKFDYRMLIYNETLLEKVLPAQLGKPTGTRINYTNSFVLGLSYFFEVFK